MTAKKIAITGASGFLGKHVLDALEDTDCEIIALSRKSRTSNSKKVKWIAGSVEDEATLLRLTEGADVCIHLAGLVSRDPKDSSLLHRLHVQGTQSLLDAMKKNNVKRLVLASTSGTVGVSKNGSTPNDSAAYALDLVLEWPYYLSKIYQEKLALDYCHKHKIEILSLRPSLLLGPGDNEGSSTKDIENLIKKRIPARINGGVSFVDVRDVARAFAYACECRAPKRGEDTFLLGAANWTLDQFFDIIAELGQVEPPKMKFNASLSLLSARLFQHAPAVLKKYVELDPISVDMATHYWYIDSSRAKDFLRFNPIDPRQTISDTIHDLRQQGRIK